MFRVGQFAGLDLHLLESAVLLASNSHPPRQRIRTSFRQVAVSPLGGTCDDLSASAHSIASSEVSGDVFPMPAEDYVDFGMLLQFFECICPRRVQQPILSLRFVDPSCYY